jgi:ATP phosphoribosyltransferase
MRASLSRRKRAVNGITIALSKGRIFEETLPLLAAAGIEPLENPETSRKLIIADHPRRCARRHRPRHRRADLRAVRRCRPRRRRQGRPARTRRRRPLPAARPENRQVPDDGRHPGRLRLRNAVRQGARLKVASKYINIAREHFAAKGVHVDLIKLYGSMELAPLAGLADAIVDLVSTGSTLKANNLVAVEHIMDISSRLIVNQAALKLKRER